MFQDFADLKDKPNNRIPNFSHLMNKYSTRNKVKSPSMEASAELVDAAHTPLQRGYIDSRGVDEERSRRVRKLYEQHSPVAPADGQPRKSRKRRSHDKFENMVSSNYF